MAQDQHYLSTYYTIEEKLNRKFRTYLDEANYQAVTDLTEALNNILYQPSTLKEPQFSLSKDIKILNQINSLCETLSKGELYTIINFLKSKLDWLEFTCLQPGTSYDDTDYSPVKSRINK
jgi:hypothetical protein